MCRVGRKRQAGTGSVGHARLTVFFWVTEDGVTGTGSEYREPPKVERTGGLTIHGYTKKKVKGPCGFRSQSLGSRG